MSLVQTERQYLAALKSQANVREQLLRIREKPDSYFLATLGLADQAKVAMTAYLAALRADMVVYEERVSKERVGRWMLLASGRRFWPQDPRADEIFVEDIAHALAAINRFSGHTTKPYSVAQHSVLVSEILPPKVKLFGLLHDAAEAYLGDIVTPVKKLLKDFGPLEDGVMRAVAERFGFAHQLDEENAAKAVKWADTVLLVTEARDLTKLGCLSYDAGVLPLDAGITECWSPEEAERRFLDAFEALNGQRAERGLSVQVAVRGRVAESGSVLGREHDLTGGA